MPTVRNYRLSYREDRAIFPTVPNLWTKVWLGIALLALLLPPLIFGQYALYMLNLAGIAAIGALGLNLLTGYAGQISLGHASFLALGAYATANFAKLGLPFFAVIPLAGTIAAIAGCVVAVPALRLKGLYLALATLAFFFIVDFAIRKTTGLTGGSVGTHVPRPSAFGLTLQGDAAFYYLVLLVLALATTFAKNLERTKIGRGFIAIRDSDTAAEMSGIPLFRYKLLAFVVSSFFGGMAGSLLGYYLQFIGPDNFGLRVSISYIAMIIVGGLGTVFGSLLGALFISLLPEAVRVSVHALSGIFPSLQIAQQGAFIEGTVYGLAIVLFLVFKPDGLIRFWRDARQYFRSWPFTY